MKKYLIVGLLFVCGIIILGSCAKDEDLSPQYPFTIVVKTLDDSTRVQNIFVEVFAPVNRSKVVFEGFSDERGEIGFKYSQDAVFLVRATRGSNPYTYIGCTFVRLSENSNVYQTVYIRPYNAEVEGC